MTGPEEVAWTSTVAAPTPTQLDASERPWNSFPRGAIAHYSGGRAIRPIEASTIGKAVDFHREALAALGPDRGTAYIREQETHMSHEDALRMAHEYALANALWEVLVRSAKHAPPELRHFLNKPRHTYSFKRPSLSRKRRSWRGACLTGKESATI